MKSLMFRASWWVYSTLLVYEWRGDELLQYQSSLERSDRFFRKTAYLVGIYVSTPVGSLKLYSAGCSLMRGGISCKGSFESLNESMPFCRNSALPINCSVVCCPIPVHAWEAELPVTHSERKNWHWCSSRNFDRYFSH